MFICDAPHHTDFWDFNFAQVSRCVCVRCAEPTQMIDYVERALFACAYTKENVFLMYKTTIAYVYIYYTCVGHPHRKTCLSFRRINISIVHSVMFYRLLNIIKYAHDLRRKIRYARGNEKHTFK